MPITVACPECSSQLSAPESAVGRKVKCPKCGTAFPINAPKANGSSTSSAGVRASKPGSPPALSKASPPPAEEDRPTNVRRRRRSEDEEDETPSHARRRRIEEDEDHDEPRPRRRRSQSGAGGPATGLQMGLGIAGLVLGILGLLFAFIPCLGIFVTLPLGGVGLLLGVIGLIVALVRKGGLGFPIAGSAVSGAGIVAALIMWFVVMAAFRSGGNALQQAAIEANNRNIDAMRKAQEDFAKNQPNLNAPPTPPAGQVTLVAGTGLLNGQLTLTDPKDRALGLSACKVYTLNLTAGKTYQIDMTSAQIDSYLRLEDAAGKELAHDDDGGGSLNARITYQCRTSGTYRIVATTFRGGTTGGFTLRVQEVGNPNGIPAPIPGPGPSPQPIALTLQGGSVEIKGELTNADPKDTKYAGSAYKVYTVQMTPGKTYQIDMIKESGEIDPILRLEGLKGKTLMEDDDGGRFPNAKIIYQCTRGGTYRIIATTLLSPGGFTLRIQEAGKAKPLPNQGAAPAGQPLFFVNGGCQVNPVLLGTDPKDKMSNQPFKDFTIPMQAGKTYQIEMECDNFVPYLRLEHPRGFQVQANYGKDGKEHRTSFVYPCRDNDAGVYRIIATRFSGADGVFNLKVFEK